MAKVPNLTDSQKLRLGRLEPQLKTAVRNKDFKTAQQIIYDIRGILAPTGHYTRLAECKNWLYDLAIEVGEYSFAESGLIGSRKTINTNTRVHLEATALLAICYLRTKKYVEAKPYIREVLQNVKVITSPNTRKEFHKAIIERFDEECVLYSLKEDGIVKMDTEEVQHLANEILILDSNTENIYLNLGKSLPLHTKQILFQIDEFAKNQLPSAERLMLPSPKDIIKDEVAGKTVFSSLKRVIYNSLCDSKSAIYQAVFTNALGIVLDKKYITTAIVTALVNLGIGLKALAVYAAALVIRFGLDVYCEHYKPIGIMEVRS